MAAPLTPGAALWASTTTPDASSGAPLSPGAALWASSTPAAASAAPLSPGAALWSAGQPAAPVDPWAGKRSGVDKAAGKVGGLISGIVGGAVHIGSVGLGDLNQNIHGHPTGVLQGGGDIEKQIIKPTLSGYRDKYYSRDVLQNMWHDPVGTALDIATLASGGGARIAALGMLPKVGEVTAAERASQIKSALLTGKYQGPLRTIDVTLPGSDAAVTVRTLPRNAARASRMIATDKALKALPQGLANKVGIGNESRAARAINATAVTRRLKHEATDARVNQQRTFARLSGKERVALNILNRVPLPDRLEAWKASIPTDDLAAQKLAQQLNDPKIRELYDNPSEKMLAAHAAGAAAADYATRLQVGNVTTELGKDGKPRVVQGLTAETAAASPYRHMRLASGARFVKETPARVGKASTRLLAHRSYTERLEKLHGKAAARAAGTSKLGKHHATPLEMQFSPAQLREIGDVVPASNREFDVQAELDHLNKKLLLLRKQLPADSPEIDALVKQKTSWQKLNLLRRDTENLATQYGAHAEELGAGAKTTKLPSEAYLNQPGKAMDRYVKVLVNPDNPRDIHYKLGNVGHENLPRYHERRWYQGDAVIEDGKIARINYGGGNIQRAAPPQEMQDAALAQMRKELGTPEGASITVPAIPGEEEIAAKIEALRAEIKTARGPGDDALAKAMNSLEASLRELRKERKTLNEPTSRQLPSGVVLTKEGARLEPRGYQRAQNLGAALSVARDRLEQMEAAAARRVTPTGLVGGQTMGQALGVAGPSLHAEIKAEIESAGRPLPFHMPDKMADKRSGYVGGKSGGRTPPPTGIHQSEGTLFTTGRVALHIDTAGPSFMRAAMRDAAIDKHAQVLKVAIPAPDGHLAHGYRWVRTVRGQAIPHSASAYGAHVHDIDESFPAFADESLTDVNPGADPATIATDAKGQRLMVPERFASVLENDLTVQRSLAAKIDRQIMQVWRALILKLRVPWLENNVFGNTFMAAVRFAGPNGLVAVLGMIRETKGVRAARRALRLADTHGQHLSDELIREKLPELSRLGTGVGTQLPTGTLAKYPKIQRALRVPTAILDALPKIDRATEGALRRAAAETVLRGSDEVKAIYKAMPEQTRSWHEAMSQGLDNPDLRRLVVREVNDALGNFLSLTPAENGAVRSLIPFYAWLREISRITAKLPLDTPGRADILAQIGMIGEQQQNSTLGGLPSYGQGWIANGAPAGDLQKIWALRGANPYTSAIDTASSLGALLPGGTPANMNKLLGDLNPFLQAGIHAAADVTSPHQGVPKTSTLGLLGDTAKTVLLGLPETRLYTNPPSKLYPTRTREDLIAQFFGDLRRTISLQQAHYNAAQGK